MLRHMQMKTSRETGRTAPPRTSKAGRARHLPRTLRLAVVVTAALLTAGGRPSIRFTKPVVLPEAGLQVKLMPKAVSQPMSSPTIHTYRGQQNDQTSLVDLYDPLEIWRRTQHIGHWSDDHANKLSIAEMT